MQNLFSRFSVCWFHILHSNSRRVLNLRILNYFGSRMSTQEYSEQLLECKRRIKEWEKQFLLENNKQPSKSDVKANKDIHRAYKTYNHLKEKIKRRAARDSASESKKSGQDVSIDTSVDVQLEPVVRGISVSLTDDEMDNDPFTMAETAANAELGPTPQANGKVLSIFDMIMSPPDSSPLKQKKSLGHQQSSPVKPRGDFGMGLIFKTPTNAAKRIQFTDLTPSRASNGKPSIMAKLRQASSPLKSGSISPEKGLSTPTKKDTEPVAETPFYLGKVNNKFLFNENPSVSSPFNNILTTPTKAPAASTFQVSPSPLKLQRVVSFGATRSVSEIFKSFESLDDEDFEAQKLEIEREFQVNEEEESVLKKETEEVPNPRKRKAITQKRTTRRWKIKPNSHLDNEDALEGKNIHEEIERLEAEERISHTKYMEGSKKQEVQLHDEEEEEEEDDDDEPAPSVPIVSKSTNKKLKPISNNFQRLKINDPRTKKFKQRMRRR